MNLRNGLADLVSWFANLLAPVSEPEWAVTEDDIASDRFARRARAEGKPASL